MILHAKHVQGPCIIHADDTDVLVLILSHSNTLHAAYMKAGRGSKSTIINIKSVRDQIAKDLPPGTSLQDFLKSLTGLHALTGCDTVSAFTGQKKSKAFKMLMKNGKYVRAYMNIGISWNVSSVNLLRYEMYCAKGGKIEPEDVPPCHSSLKLYVTRAKLAFGIERYCHVLIFHAQTVMVGRYLEALLTSDGWIKACL